MSAVVVEHSIPLVLEGQQFWDELTRACQRHVDAINRVALSDGVSTDHLILCDKEPGLRMLKSGYPSTNVNVRLSLKSWGPVLVASISGQQDRMKRFSTNELEIPIALDLDGSVVAVFDEGRSFSAEELARYLMRSFRRCFPLLPLPC